MSELKTLKKPEVSIVIPAYNEATYIDRLLAALTRQRFQDFEVIISDADSRDGTDEVIKSFKNKLSLILVKSPPKGPANGRNTGAARASGEWLLFLDADVDIDDPGFMDTLLHQTKKRGWHTSSTKLKARKASIGEKIGISIHHLYLRLLAHTKHPVAPGFCILTRRDLFNRLNGFDEKLWVAEDYDYVSRASRHGGFGYTNETYYYVDLRRFHEGGNLRVFWQSTYYEIYRFTHGFKIEKDPLNYQFGHHKKRQ